MDTITVVKGNVELSVAPDEKAFYMSKGYSVIDENGTIIEEAMLQDVASLQVKVAQLQKENAELKQLIAEKSKTKPGPKPKKTDE